jgi:hypothetical protein
MKTLTAIVLAFTLLGITAPAFAADDAACKSMWEKADANKDGMIDDKEGAALMEAVKASGKPYDADADGKLAAAEFTAACTADAFKDVKM